METTTCRSSFSSSPVSRRVIRAACSIATCGIALGAAPLLGVSSAFAQGPAENVPEMGATLRLGEVRASPYLDREGGPRHAGVLVATSELSNVIDASDRVHFELNEDVYITLPRGVTATVGQKFYTYDLGENYGDRGQVVIPTGILTVRRVGQGQEATTVRITQLFQKVSAGQGVLPVNDSAWVAAANTGPAAVSDGVEGQVVWVENESVVPTKQFYLIINVGSKQDVHLGDQFTLYRPATPDPLHHTVLPPAVIGVVKVTRVNEYGCGAIIISQSQPAIAIGNSARLTAKMP